MYKIKYLLTGHEFVLPDDTAQELKDNFPNDYRIIEKNGKKFTDKKTIIKFKDGSIRELVVEEPLTTPLSLKGRGSKREEPLTTPLSHMWQGSIKDKSHTNSKELNHSTKGGLSKNENN